MHTQPPVTTIDPEKTYVYKESFGPDGTSNNKDAFETRDGLGSDENMLLIAAIVLSSFGAEGGTITEVEDGELEVRRVGFESFWRITIK